jgi:4-carboxymuconolactone decarboxylase
MRVRYRCLLWSLLLLSTSALALEPSSGVTVTPLAKETASWDGNPIRYPDGEAEMTALLVEVAPGGQTGWHCHPVPSFAYVLEGSLEVTLDDGRVKHLEAGDVLAEVVGRLHDGRNTGSVAAKLVVFYAGAAGMPLSLRDADCVRGSAMALVDSPFAANDTHGVTRMTFPDEPNSRIAPLSTDDLRPEWVAILDRLPGAGLKGEGFPRNLLGILMLNQETLGPLLDYWVTSKSKMGLTMREQELVILRMGVLYRSEYVWKHHVKVGREFGIEDAELEAVREGSYDAFTEPRERALLELTDALVNDRSLSPALWDRTSQVLQPRDYVDLISLVSQYVLFALTNVGFQVQLEPAVAELPGIAD